MNIGGKQGLVLRDPFLYTDKVIFIPREVVAVVQFFDGTKTCRDIQAEIERRSGELIAVEDIMKVADELDKSYYLVSESFLRLKRRVEEDFFRSAVRPPVHMGAGYHADPEKLKEELSSYFAQITEGADGASVPVGGPAGNDLAAVIAPHISIASGADSFARAYAAVKRAPRADLYVILGVGHAGIEELYSGTKKDFMTPLGLVGTNGGFVDDLNARFRGRLFAGEMLHRTEHTVEFQAVFLKYVLGDAPFAIAPILASFPHTIFHSDRLAPIREMAFEFIAALKEAIAAFGGKVVLIASVDFAHVGIKYGDENPPSPEYLEAVRERDGQMIEIIASGDRDRFLEHIASDDDKRRICGFPAIYTMLSVLEDKKGTLLSYGSTVMDSADSTVTFASMTFADARANGAKTGPAQEDDRNK